MKRHELFRVGRIMDATYDDVGNITVVGDRIDLFGGDPDRPSDLPIPYGVVAKFDPLGRVLWSTSTTGEVPSTPAPSATTQRLAASPGELTHGPFGAATSLRALDQRGRQIIAAGVTTTATLLVEGQRPEDAEALNRYVDGVATFVQAVRD